MPNRAITVAAVAVSVLCMLISSPSVLGYDVLTSEDQGSAGYQERLADLERKWSYEFGFSGISTFAHLPHVKCLTRLEERFDIAVLGVPFDTAVSYRPGARFGPRAIRQGSARQTSLRAYNPRAGLNPYASWAKVIDCGDVPVSPFDNALALRQMSEAYLELGRRTPHNHAIATRPKIVTLGGDHSLALPALRALYEIYGRKIHVLHFDAHLDTWAPSAYGTGWLDPEAPMEEHQIAFNHGSMFWLGWKEGIIASPSVHAGLRCRLTDIGDHEDDEIQGWIRIASDEMSPDLLGPIGIAEKIKKTLGEEVPVYLSIDIDVLDPGLAPGTGTPEPGGWLTRELIRVLRAIENLNVVGADVVEVAPSYDGAGEATALAAAQVVYEVLTSIVRHGAKKNETHDSIKDEL